MNQKDADVSLNQENGLALLPFLVFIVIYLGAGLIMQSRGVEMAFYQFPWWWQSQLPCWWRS